MRILHVIPTYLPSTRYGGPIVSVHGLCSALAKRGHDVHVFTTNVDGDANSPVPLHAPVENDGVKISYFSVPLLRRLYWAPEMAIALEREMPRFDVVHTHSVFLWPTWAAARVARRHAIPYILAPRGMLVTDLIRRKSMFQKKLWIALVEKNNIEKAAGIHVTSAVEGTELARFGFRLPRVYEVPNGFNPEDASSSITGALAWPVEAVLNSGKPVVLYVGRINWEKGLDRLIRAMAEVPEALLLAVGNDEEGYTSQLIALARHERVNDRVRFVGPVYGAAKAEIYRRATLFVLPSYSENFGNVTLEAMGAGCPVIVTPEVGACSVVAESRAGLVVSGEPRALAEAIRALLGSTAMQREMGARGRNWILTRNSWSSVAQQIMYVYRHAIDEWKAR